MSSSGRSATAGSRLFISIRSAASWCQPLQERVVPVGAVIAGLGAARVAMGGNLIRPTRSRQEGPPRSIHRAGTGVDGVTRTRLASESRHGVARRPRSAVSWGLQGKWHLAASYTSHWLTADRAPRSAPPPRLQPFGTHSDPTRYMATSSPGAAPLQRDQTIDRNDADAVEAALAASGDASAFERLYRAHVARIHSL